MIENPLVSIIICTYNRSNLLKKTLYSLIKVENIEKCEVFVIDNASTDNTRSVVNKINSSESLNYNVKYILEKKQGLSFARNTGITHSTGKIVAFLDDDAIPKKTWINSIIEAFEISDNVIAIGGPVLPDFEVEKPKWLSPSLESLYSILDLDNKIMEFPAKKFPVGANMAFRSFLFDELKFPVKLGRVGNTLISGEEAWIFKKLIETYKYAKVYYIPGMGVKHFIPKERLREKWIMDRFYHEGVSIAIGAKDCSFRKKMKMLLVASIKGLITCFSLFFLFFAKNKRLLYKCRLNKIKGIYVTLKIKYL